MKQPSETPFVTAALVLVILLALWWIDSDGQFPGGLLGVLFALACIVGGCLFLYLASLNRWRANDELRRLAEQHEFERGPHIYRPTILDGVPGWMFDDHGVRDFIPAPPGSRIVTTVGKANAAAPEGTTANATPTKETKGRG